MGQQELPERVSELHEIYRSTPGISEQERIEKGLELAFQKGRIEGEQTHNGYILKLQSELKEFKRKLDAYERDQQNVKKLQGENRKLKKQNKELAEKNEGLENLVNTDEILLERARLETKYEEYLSELEQIQDSDAKDQIIKERILQLRQNMFGLQGQMSAFLEENYPEQEQLTIDILVTGENYVVIRNMVHLHNYGLQKQPLIRASIPPGYQILDDDLKELIHQDLNWLSFSTSESPYLHKFIDAVTVPVLSAGGLLGLGYVGAQIHGILGYCLGAAVGFITGGFLGGIICVSIEALKRSSRINKITTAVQSANIDYVVDEELGKNPNNVVYQALADIANQLQSQNKRITAKMVWAEAKNFDLVSACIAAGANFEKLKDTNRAIAEYEQALGPNPQNSWLLNTIGNFYFNQGKHQLALEYFQNSLKIEDDHVVRINLADNLLKLARYKEAQTEIEAVKAKQPNNVRAYTIDAQRLIQLGHTEKATDVYRKVLELDPKNKEALNYLK